MRYFQVVGKIVDAETEDGLGVIETNACADHLMAALLNGQIIDPAIHGTKDEIGIFFCVEDDDFDKLVERSRARWEQAKK